jgi:hypothetical protein
MHFFFLIKRKPALKEKIISLVKLLRNIHIAFIALPTAFSFANTIPFMSLQIRSSTILFNGLRIKMSSPIDEFRRRCVALQPFIRCYLPYDAGYPIHFLLTRRIYII